MPFRTANPGSVSVGEPRLHVQGEVFGPGDPVSLWDYMAEVRITSEIRVDEAALLASTGLNRLESLAATLQVDCVHTGFRRVERKILRPGSPTTVGVEVPAHTVAFELEVRGGLTLAEELPTNADAIAYRRGSRVFWEQKRTRFELEGQGGGFPVEAFDFQAAGLPATAAWKLNFSADDLEKPFMAAVRLLVNTSHPRSAEILSGDSGLIQSVVFHDVLEELLVTVADGDLATQSNFEEGTVGGVLNDLTHTYLGHGLHESVQSLRNNRSLALTRLQDVTGFLQGKAS
ncbi:hypothetical protein [Tessaracoccus antarcticus]|nr:hypothetical protein [Tessaracoccus antarcticus]